MLFVLLFSCAPKDSPPVSFVSEELASRGTVVDDYHGTPVADPYRWMEDADSAQTVEWTAARHEEFFAYTDSLSQRQWLHERFVNLWRYDEEGVPSQCLKSDKMTYSVKLADLDKRQMFIKDDASSEGRLLLDPNTWEETQTLAFFSPSPDCQWVAYGVANAGDENPVMHVMNIDTGEVLEDTFRGWKHGSASWMADSSGFYYSAKPLVGEVPEGEEFYWHRSWRHQLHTTAENDELAFSDPDVKETWHGVWQSEDGRWTMRYRGLFNVNQIWIAPSDGSAEPKAMTQEMDIEYGVDVVDDKVLITTDWQAPNNRVMIADAADPEQSNWQPFIPETEDKLSYISLVGGHIYAVYQHNASSQIHIYGMDGVKQGEVELPTIGSASVWGQWARPEVWVSFSSFAHPREVFTYDVHTDSLSLYQASPIDIDVSNMAVSQVFYPSKDGTQVSMFIIANKDAQGPVPLLLTGYGGFNISMTPRFSTRNAVWLEAGGAVAIPNLRGGGEYGRQWHEAGMKENKQNVFDDFIFAAEYLIANGHTTADQLAISGGSNGGLLVSAVVTQRPELFAAVQCAVPLTDMVRFHHFGIANIWTEEYGSADDPDAFPYIHAYSPYHNVNSGVDYPSILVTGSTNDARTDPVHARKFMAAVRWADADHGQEEPILLHIQSDSGHGGAVSIEDSADQVARGLSFLMANIGMNAP